MKKFFKYLGFLVLALVFLFLIAVAYNFYRIRTGGLVKWDNKWYTKQELAEKYPPQYYEAEAQNTPEEVYAEFRQALLAGDTEKALEYITAEKRDEYREAFKDEERLKDWVNKLPENITQEEVLGNYAYYDIDYGTKNKNTLTFIKDRAGFWRID